MDPHVATRQLLAMGVFKRQRDGRAAFRHSLLRAAVEKSVSDRLRDPGSRRRVPLLPGGHGHGRRRASPAARVSRGERRLPRARPRPCTSISPTARDSRHAYVEAETLYSRSLGHLEEADLRRRMIALRGRGFMRYRMSRRDAVDDLMEALATARALQDRRAEIEILLDAATALDWMAEYRKSRELVSDAETLLATSEGPGEGRSASRLPARRSRAGALALLRGDAGDREAAAGDRDRRATRRRGLRDPRHLAVAARQPRCRFTARSRRRSGCARRS